ncbi:MAG: Recombination protein RecR [Candidatus Collierbacteria bacterium GW2011_GWB1_45_35]|uniref:Recombination protein RecR n=2 Tax=Candidatus Collieribacteriota TaxID=1752725 RepID=A0A0G1NNJ3_9BACT|nr:MAG: Recombination protein RecR [Microgenomates group bacterium GW2011_GWC1_44_23]KKT85784.1 MAG: Recombination protein RecR [Candidatus Collierbacteria bacterium GW2011_GWA2_44_99]KKT94835.1 MAG: Recombination protein RecR [Candidatus Collierbacteria bacterium GW2011_GWA1_45_15]KKT99663.1 MAG: Recombination protein RecR [Candidatus Collierbacteria bacterium GW2011_GWB2_45_17]KKU05078.1 MAG: Recombination protein RecR [Candidatus Collierbacteria bacterium GW2011_GWB1_45_35]KKU07171.1 MAG: R
MRSIRPVQKVIDAFEALPGIGPKSAARLAYYLLNVPQEKLSKFSEALIRLKKDTKLCSLCFNVGEEEFCPVCQDESRDKSQVCVVETSLDLLAFERADGYKGIYHVLGGAVAPLSGIGPNDLRIPQLMARLKTGEIKELILATNPNMEGEATAMYITERMKEMGLRDTVKVTRIGRGLPTGADIEYADGQTLTRALEGRGEM